MLLLNIFFHLQDQSGNPRAYIATQGPLSNTIADFWLMIWTERVPAIVMITKLVEAGKAKCEAYLPEEGQSSCQHGNVNIAIESTEETDGYTIRRLVIRVISIIIISIINRKLKN